MKIATTLLDNHEILRIAEGLLFSWAYEISHGNLTNKSRYEYLLDIFSRADLLSNDIGTIRTYITTYLIEVHKVKTFGVNITN